MHRSLMQNDDIPQMIHTLGKKNAKLSKSTSRIGTASDTDDFRHELERDLKEGTDLCTRIMEALKDAAHR